MIKIRASAIVVLLFCGIQLTMCETTKAQRRGFNYDEEKVPKFTLPDPLQVDGQQIDSSEKWSDIARPYWLNKFKDHVYGESFLENVQCEFVVKESGLLNENIRRKQVQIICKGKGASKIVNLLLYLPNDDSKAHPVFLGLNFFGNQSTNPDPAIFLPTTWMRNRDHFGITENRATEESRGKSASRWPVEMIVKQGYGLVTVYYGDIDPDFDDGYRNGLHSLVPQEQIDLTRATSISSWSWGLSRVMDYFESDDEIAQQRVALLGHSRLGKTSLWAGAQDERFALVISNNSGCGGAALHRRAFGETVKQINKAFPHWFCKKFSEYDDNEDDCPVDQHILIGLIAPRPVYVASATEDQWADPRGEFLSAKNAGSIYELFGKLGIEGEFPKPDLSVGSTIGYHLRTGKHDVKDTDWQNYIDFADRWLAK